MLLVSMAQKFIFGGSESQISVTSLLLIRQEIFHFSRENLNPVQTIPTTKKKKHSRKYLKKSNIQRDAATQNMMLVILNHLHTNDLI